jgi:hypothetical protein
VTEPRNTGEFIVWLNDHIARLEAHANANTLEATVYVEVWSDAHGWATEHLSHQDAQLLGPRPIPYAGLPGWDTIHKLKLLRNRLIGNEGGSADVALPPETMAEARASLAYLHELAPLNTTVRNEVIGLSVKLDRRTPAPVDTRAETTPAVRTERVEGGTLPADSNTILPVMLSASDIAVKIGRKRESVTSFLTRFAGKKPDCRVAVKSKRKNEPSWLYRTADVWPALEQWMEDNPCN